MRKSICLIVVFVVLLFNCSGAFGQGKKRTVKDDNQLAFLFFDDDFIQKLEGVVKGVVSAEKVSEEALISKDQAW